MSEKEIAYSVIPQKFNVIDSNGTQNNLENEP